MARPFKANRQSRIDLIPVLINLSSDQTSDSVFTLREHLVCLTLTSRVPLVTYF